MATFTVTNANDSGAGSLRQAVLAANASAGVDVIDFDVAVFDGEAADIIRLTSGEIDITDVLVITGGPAGVTITGDAAGDDVLLPGGITDVDATEDRIFDNDRIFDSTAILTIDGLTLTGGRASSDEGGGAVRGTIVTLTDSTVRGNFSGGSTFGGYRDGGGINATKSLVVEGSDISGNRTEGSGGGLYGASVLVINSTISDNRTGFEQAGGGIAGGSVRIENTRITGNHANVSGGIFVFGDLSVIDSVVSENTSDYSGAGVGAFGHVYVADSTISGNRGGGEGAGIRGIGGVTVLRSTVSDNIGAGHGGGVYSRNAVVIRDSTVSGNIARPEYGYAAGGGVFSHGAVYVAQSTITGNATVQSYSYATQGGGIQAASITLENSIVSGNAAGAEADDVFGALSLSGGNILGADRFEGDADIGDAAAAEVFAETVEVVPGVLAGALGDNGGPTRTVALRLDPGNPAIDRADPNSASFIDQRGVQRVAPDLGAFEATAPGGGLFLVGGPEADGLAGDALADILWGLGGDDDLWGNAGGDFLKGGGGRDVLEGRSGRDALFGGAGRDRLNGGTGDDALCGGSGLDVFRFGPGFGRDRIGDFDADAAGGQDRIDLRPLGITAADFDDRVALADLGGATRIKIAGYGTIFCEGVTGEGANALDRTDFLL